MKSKYETQEEDIIEKAEKYAKGLHGRSYRNLPIEEAYRIREIAYRQWFEETKDEE